MRDEEGQGSRRNRRSQRGLRAGMLSADNTSGRLYEGPPRFKAQCKHCTQPRNRHCGTCRACPGFHRDGCNTVIGMAKSGVLR